MRLFASFRIHVEGLELAVWADIVRPFEDRAVISAVGRVLRSQAQFCPRPGQFLHALRGQSAPRDTPRSTTSLRKRDCVTLGELMGDSERAEAMCEWIDGCKQFRTTTDYLDRIKKLNQMPGPRVDVLCNKHAGVYLALQRRRT